MIEKQILKLLLGKKFYTKYKGQISRNVFQGSFGSLFDTVQKAHEKYDADIKIDELYALHTTMFNPALGDRSLDVSKKWLAFMGKHIKKDTVTAVHDSPRQAYNLCRQRLCRDMVAQL